MNKVILVGRLTRDPELRYTGSNTPVATFTLAINRPFNNQNGEREADFINCVVWRKQAETIKNYVSQGSQLAVEGRIQVRNYEDQNGQRRYVTEVVVESFDFIGSRRDSNNGSNYNSSNSNNNNNNTANNYQSPFPDAPSDNKTPYDFSSDQGVQGADISNDVYADFGSSIEVSDDDLPF